MSYPIRKLSSAQLDALVAEKVMGYVRCPPPPVEIARANADGFPVRQGPWWSVYGIENDIAARMDIPMFSTDIAAAFVVVDKMKRHATVWIRDRQACSKVVNARK